MADENALVALGERLVAQVVELGIVGGGPLKPATEVAEEHLAGADGDREEAIHRLVAAHVRMAAVSGFATGLGGAATLPVTVPAAMAGLYVVAARMAAGIAYLRGYDIGSAQVRSAILVSLLGSAGAPTLETAGIELGTGSTSAALRRQPAGALVEINRTVGLRLVAKAGEKGMVNLTKLVPLVGGPIGAAVDGVGAKTIAGYAMRTFPPLVPRVVIAPDVVDGEVV